MSLSNSLILMFQTLPNTNIPLISYDIAMIFSPSILFGTLVGILLILVLPDIFLLMMLLIILPATGIRTVYSAVLLWREETAKKESKSSNFEQIEDLEPQKTPGPSKV